MDPKLSVVAAFDDLIRNSKVLNVGIEPEFISYIRGIEEWKKKWFASESKVESLMDEVRKLKAERGSLLTQLEYVRRHLDDEIKKRKRIEDDRENMDRQICLIRELLSDKTHKSILTEADREKLAFLSTTVQKSYCSPRSPKRAVDLESSGSILSPDDISYDKTEEDLDYSHLRSGRKWKRPSAPPMDDDLNDTPPKRQKNDGHDGRTVVTTTTIMMAEDGKPLSTTTEVSGPKKMNKSYSEPALDNHDLSTIDEREAESDPESDDSYFGTPRNRNNNRKKSGKYPGGILKKTPSDSAVCTPSLRKNSSLTNGLNKLHTLFSRSVLRGEDCFTCGRRIKFGRLSMKCKDCKVTCHPECKDNLPLPCIYQGATTPGKPKKPISGVIADYAPLDPPMIPGIVIHCVNEVEARGLNETGIYRVPGIDKQIKELKERFFRGRGTPNLSTIADINVVCCCLKDFLRELKEPLLTYSLWKSFVSAAENQNQEVGLAELYDVINKLPQPNRDTVAFLMLHLQRVADSTECKMPVNNLAKVFGPTVVGYSNPDPEPLQMINETRCQTAVMEKLLFLPTDYWISFINVENDSLYPATPNLTTGTPGTPDSRYPSSMLGPVLTPGSYEQERNKTLSKTPFTPKFGNRHKTPHKKPSHLFGPINNE